MTVAETPEPALAVAARPRAVEVAVAGEPAQLTESAPAASFEAALPAACVASDDMSEAAGPAGFGELAESAQTEWMAPSPFQVHHESCWML